MLFTVEKPASGAKRLVVQSQSGDRLSFEDGATGDLSAAEILALLLTVDGPGSGLNADLVDGCTVDDGDVGTDVLWTSDLLTTLLAGKAASSHTHAATDITSHAASHILSGSAEIDGDRLGVSWNPGIGEYTPDSSPTEAGNVDHLTAHLKGIGTALSGKAASSHNHSSTDITSHAASHILSGSAEIDGDRLGISWNPASTEYVPDSSPTEAGNVDDLTAHLKGIATALGLKVKAVYGFWYGGVVTLSSGSDTVLGLGTEVIKSSGLSMASNVLTVSPSLTALAIVATTMYEATVTGDAQASMQIEQDPATGTFAVITGTRKDCGVNSANAQLDRQTITTIAIVAPGNNYKYRLTGKIQSGSATTKTVAAGTSLIVFGVGAGL